MADPSTVRDLYRQLMSINKVAFGAGLYNGAYHALAGALCCAREIEGDQPLLAVEQVAKDELAWIDNHVPEYEHSTLSAAQRNHISVFATLAIQAATVARGRQSQRRLKNLDPFDFGEQQSRS